jgi:hypothetical protein
MCLSVTTEVSLLANVVHGCSAALHYVVQLLGLSRSSVRLCPVTLCHHKQAVSVCRTLRVCFAVQSSVQLLAGGA